MRLRNFTAIVALLGTLGTAHATDTSTLLRELVQENPALAASNREAEAAQADLWAARGSRLPQLRIEGSASTLEETLRVNGGPGSLTGTREPLGATAVVEQALFTSGRIGGSVGVARAQARGAKLSVDQARQDLLVQGAAAIADVVRDRSVLAERRRNEETVGSRLAESVARRKAGLATNTDVQQSEARLAQAEAERIAAQGALLRSEAAFLRLFDKRPTDDLLLPTSPAAMPDNLQVALDQALANNPDLGVSEQQAEAARQGVKQARGAYLPQVSLNASAGYIDNERFGIDLGQAEQYTLSVQGSWALFDGGSSFARTRAAKRRRDAATSGLEQARRLVREQTIGAWTNMLASRSAVRAREAQAVAAASAAEGVSAEFRSGRRTRLDVLDADRERTNADVALIAARRDLAVAEYSLLRAMGQL